MVTRYGRLRDGVRATGAEVAEEDYKHEDKANTISRLRQAPTRESIGVRRFSGSTPKVHLPHPAWYLRSWILNRPLGVGCGRCRLGARDQPRDLVRVDGSASFLGRSSYVEDVLEHQRWSEHVDGRPLMTNRSDYGTTLEARKRMADCHADWPLHRSIRTTMFCGMPLK